MDETNPTRESGTPTISVELATPADAQAVAEILSSGVQTKVAHGDMAWGTKPYTAEDVHNRIAEGSMYIARLGKDPIGTFSLFWDDELIWGDQPPTAAYLHSLAVSNEHQGMNLGEQLIEWAGHQAAQNGKQLLRIDIPPENDGLKAYYEKLGFTHVQDREVEAPRATYIASLYEKPTIE